MRDAYWKEIDKSEELAKVRKGVADDLKKLLKDEKDDVNELLRKTTELINAEFKRSTIIKKLKTDELKWNKDVAAYNLKVAEQTKENAIQDVALTEWKAQVASDAFGVLSQIAGEQTIAGKAFAIAQATIDTWAAANKALASGPPPWNFIVMGTVIAAGLANVAKIISVKTEGLTASPTTPTAVSSSPPAQRTFATPTGSTIFTQPQLSQAQLNAIPNQNLLTAADIANALKNLPAPIVTVEDINAKVKQKNKVEVRANI
jgi:hypothetical protein